MKLSFSSIEEFLTELEHAANAEAVEQGILRVTCRISIATSSPATSRYRAPVPLRA